MKYKKILLFILLLIFPIFVSAKDIFGLKWETDKDTLVEGREGLLKVIFPDNNIKYNNGLAISRLYFTLNEKEEEILLKTRFRTHDKNGNILADKNFNNLIIINMQEKDEYIYAFVAKIDDLLSLSIDRRNDGESEEIPELNVFYIRKYDSNLNVVAEKNITDLIIGTIDELNMENLQSIYISMATKLIGYNFLSTENNIILLNGEDNYSFDKDLKNVTILNIDNAIKHFKDLDYIKETLDFNIEFDEDEEFLERKYFSANVQEDGIYASGFEIEASRGPKPQNKKYGLSIHRTWDAMVDIEINEGDDEEEFQGITGYIKREDNNGNIVWEKRLDDFAIVFNTKIINDYIVAIGANVNVVKDYKDIINNDITPYTKIVVLDKDGNIVQTIDNKGLAYELVPINSGFVVSNISNLKIHLPEERKGMLNPQEFIEKTSSHQKFTDILSEPIDDEEELTDYGVVNDIISGQVNNQVYYFTKNIETKISGKGSVDVVESQVPGNPVTFVVQPEKGYTLGNVIVFDKDGNELVFTDYTFTMPSADVTIIANFLPSNPFTGGEIKFIVIIALLFSALHILSCLKKNKLYRI